mmetsp:Transcript_9372/g.13328  ORF Transcript_9372/g.13328 Transcript_9372/m.13328 type:complete len:231 (-) Transcript_9372:146-838(-)
MSLSFVSSAVLSSTDGVSHNEEKQIESKETKIVRDKQGQEGHRPLFEQLRSNKEDEETKREEFQRAIMRGTLALDEEDCAHLDTLQKQRRERDDAVKASVESELALFRAAKEERTQSQLLEVQEEDHETDTQKDGPLPTVTETSTAHSRTTEVSKPKQKAMPKIIVMRRRRKESGNENGEDVGKETKKLKTDDNKIKSESSKDQTDEEKEESVGLGGLLGGYGSSDEDSD